MQFRQFWLAPVLAGALSASSSIAADAAEQFDLACEGERTSKLSEPMKPVSFGMRIDLAANKWCWDHCERIYDIAEVHPDRLVFKNQSVETVRKSMLWKASVSRVTGEYRAVHIETRPYRSYFKQQGACELRPFSGFPAAKF